jgi:hypothetical protein
MNQLTIATPDNVIARPEGPWQSLALQAENAIVVFEIASLCSQ